MKMKIKIEKQEPTFFEQLKIGDVFIVPNARTHKNPYIKTEIAKVGGTNVNCLYLENGLLYCSDPKEEVILVNAELNVKFS